MNAQKALTKPDREAAAIRFRLLLLGMLYFTFLGLLVWSSGRLPERVASHFNQAGDPDAWMNRGSHLKFMIVFGTAFPMSILLICYLLRFLPPDLINIPHRDYWMAPARRRETLQHLLAHSLWFSCLGVIFMTGVHFLVWHANARQPPRLSVGWMLAVTAVLIIGLLWWIVALLLHFRRMPDANEANPGGTAE